MVPERKKTKHPGRRKRINLLIFLSIVFISAFLLVRLHDKIDFKWNNVGLTGNADGIELQLSTFIKAIYGVISLSVIGVGAQLYFFMKGVRHIRMIEKQEKFRLHSIKKLNSLNPELNPSLLYDVLHAHEKARQLLITSHYEEQDNSTQLELSRFALYHIMMEKSALEKLEKCLIRNSKVPEE